jgi:C_GCAxxG_C_C family probable redox protein
VIDVVGREEVVELAKCYSEEGYLCSESVLLAVSFCLGVKSDLIPKIATGFGAGVGRCGYICGAVSGGVIALGIKFGRSEPLKQDQPPHWFAQELVKRFIHEFGVVTCRELTDCDLSTEAGHQKYREENVWNVKCRRYIEGAAAQAFDIISENSM